MYSIRCDSIETLLGKEEAFRTGGDYSLFLQVFPSVDNVRASLEGYMGE